MSQIASLANSPTTQSSAPKSSLNDLDLDVFLELMIAELQNQDPLNPLENHELLQQISQIREVGATDRLSETLDSVLLGQNIASATNLIGANVEALTDTGERVTGNVRRVTIDGGQPKLDIALPSDIRAAEQGGDVARGNYTYEVVWTGTGGTTFSSEYTVDTNGLQGFDGAIRIGNLPTTDTAKRVYRTDNTGTGDRLLVGTLPSGSQTSFVDTLADDARTGEPLNEERQRLSLARRVTVSLNNVAQIEPPSN